MTPRLTEHETATRRQLAAAVGSARLGAAWAAYRDARVAGLCHEGAWEVALGVGSPHGSTEAGPPARAGTARRPPTNP